MGILDELQSVAGGVLGGGGAQAAGGQGGVPGALLSGISEHPGGVGALLEHFRQNGLGDHVNSWVNSEPGQGAAPQPLSQQQVEQGVPSGLLASIAQRTGMPPQAVSAALTTVLPMIMQHMTPGGQVPGQGQTGGLAQSLLTRFL